MARIRLVHWHGEEARERARRLEELGYGVEWEPPRGPAFFRELQQSPPEALVVDLSRLPAQGRDLGVAVRGIKGLRQVPLVFVAGVAEKVERVRGLLPDATYTTWQEIGEDLARALARPPREPVVPGDRMAGYSGTPLPRKLGIGADTVVGLIGAPAGFESLLGELPRGAQVRREPTDRCDLLLWFARSRDEVARHVHQMGERAGAKGLWILWPKKSSGVPSDLTQGVVRELGLAAGLVDYKICAVDATWSGLRFTVRKQPASPTGVTGAGRPG